VTHTFTSYLATSYFNTTTVTYDVFVTNTFVFSTSTFEVFGWSKDFFTE